MASTLEGYRFVCDRADLPTRGKKTVHLDDVKLLIVACDTGIYALEDRDPQTGGSIAHGEVLDCVLTSPNTGAKYSLKDGRLIEEQTALTVLTHWLPMWHVRVVDDQVFVSPTV
ncbi:MAG: nitrite reductase (NAD(P)H) small subunit [Chloroflexota bacterium]|nr:nitrite reductase (NAD(P)H) small subunit [Anaerolineae bacterium]HMM28219.1 nitrite reductase (NAD(P)H) small subunit [Aggregatilineaceae bacterium]